MIIKFIVRRIIEAIPALFVLLTLSFFMMRLAPGNPFSGDRKVSAEIMANIEAKYHLNDPLWTQYITYLKDFASGDLGVSFVHKDYSINQLVAHAFPVSLKLGVCAFLLAVILGVLAGSIAALKQNSFLDHMIMTFAMTGIIMPSFVIAPLLILLIAIYLKWLPAGGWQGGDLKHILLPMFVLSLAYIANIARLMRGSMIEVLKSPFIITAKAKGLPTTRVILKHAFKPAILPVISYLGPAFVGIITGSMVIEAIFGLPGIGQLFIDGALNRDYSLVLGLTAILGTLTIFFNAVVDILYAFLDPRTRN